MSSNAATLPSEPEWVRLAEAASKETDSEKLMQIVEQLCVALHKKNQQKRDVA